jgi:hypothetical protein
MLDLSEFGPPVSHLPLRGAIQGRDQHTGIHGSRAPGNPSQIAETNAHGHEPVRLVAVVIAPRAGCPVVSILSAPGNALGLGRNDPRGLFRAQRTRGLPGAPELAVAEFVQFLLKFCLVIGAPRRREHARGFFT